MPVGALWCPGFQGLVVLDKKGSIGNNCHFELTGAGFM
jgi:hypothetical protein